MQGSGRSAHLPPEAWYRTEHEAVLIMEVADAIGWGDTVRFTLFAHSRGTSVGLIAACAFPERVDRVVLVESRLGYGFGVSARILSLAIHSLCCFHTKSLSTLGTGASCRADARSLYYRSTEPQPHDTVLCRPRRGSGF